MSLGCLFHCGLHVAGCLHGSVCSVESVSMCVLACCAVSQEQEHRGEGLFLRSPLHQELPSFWGQEQVF